MQKIPWIPSTFCTALSSYHCEWYRELKLSQQAPCCYPFAVSALTRFLWRDIIDHQRRESQHTGFLQRSCFNVIPPEHIFLQIGHIKDNIMPNCTYARILKAHVTHNVCSKGRLPYGPECQKTPAISTCKDVSVWVNKRKEGDLKPAFGQAQWEQFASQQCWCPLKGSPQSLGGENHPCMQSKMVWHATVWHATILVQCQKMFPVRFWIMKHSCVTQGNKNTYLSKNCLTKGGCFCCTCSEALFLMSWQLSNKYCPCPQVLSIFPSKTSHYTVSPPHPHYRLILPTFPTG